MFSRALLALRGGIRPYHGNASRCSSTSSWQSSNARNLLTNKSKHRHQYHSSFLTPTSRRSGGPTSETVLHRYYSTSAKIHKQHDDDNDANVMMDAEIVNESVGVKLENERAVVPLMLQQLEAEQRRLESCLDSAIRKFKEVSNDSSSEDDLAKMEEALTEMRQVYEDSQHWEEALACEERLELLWGETARDNKDGNVTMKPRLGHSWYRRGRYHMHLGSPVDARKCYQRALEEFNLFHGEKKFHADKGRVLMSIAGVQFQKGSHTEALRILQEESEPQFRRHNKIMSEDDTDNDIAHPELFKCLQHQGLVCRSMEDYTQALKHYKEAKTVLLNSESNNHFDKEELRSNIQSIELDIADMHLVLDEYDNALEGFKTIWENDRSSRELDEQGQIPLTGLEGLMLHNIGRIYAQQEDNTKAIETLRDAVDMKKAWFGVMHPEVGKSLQLLGAVYTRQDRPYEALKCFEHCLIIARQQAGGNKSDPGVMLALRNIALVEGKAVPRWGEDDEHKQ